MSSRRLLDGLSILLVEDDDDLREMLGTALGEHGARITTAGSMAAARDALRSSMYDVLVTDLGLPDGHGHELGHEALRGGVTATIALTGDKRDETMNGSTASGFRMHIAKPFDPQMLAFVVASLGLNAPEG